MMSIVVGIIFTLVVFTQPAIQDQMADAQMKSMQQNVADGKMTQEQMDMAVERNPAKPGSPMFLIFGAIGVSLVSVVSLYAYSGVYLLAGKLMYKTAAPFSKVQEVVGMSFYVSIVGALLSMVIIVAMGSLYASLSPALLVENFDPLNKQHKLMAAVNLLEFWYLFVVGVGLSKIWNLSVGKSVGLVGGVWLVWTLIKVFGNFGF